MLTNHVEQFSEIIVLCVNKTELVQSPVEHHLKIYVFIV